MKKILEEYKKQIKFFITNKKYVITIIIVAILSYGFAVTHYSIGIDDLCFDRYVHGTYILSAKRWGTWLLYNVLQINEFTPFWLDAVVSIFMVVIATILCAFIRRQYGDKIKIWGYIIFSSLLISNPMINLFFMYQSTNLTIVISNLIVMICAMVIFENYFDKNKKYINLICGLLLVIPISMYESCAQTYLVLLFIMIFIKITQGKETNKRILKYFCLSIAILVLSIVLYFVIGKVLVIVLEKCNMLNENFASTDSILFDKKFWEVPFEAKKYVISVLAYTELCKYMEYLPAVTFLIFSLITIVLEIVQSIKMRKASRMLCILGILLSNFVLILIQVTIAFRMQFSWIVTFAFMGIYIYQRLGNKKIIKYFVNIAIILIVIIHTRTLNQYFYNDYKRYEQEKWIANDIATNVTKNCDYENKPLYYIVSEQKGKNYIMNYENSHSVIKWGTFAFQECQTETTKFINEHGYHFKYITEEQGKEAEQKYKQLSEQEKDKSIIELDDVIIVNLNVYDF